MNTQNESQDSQQSQKPEIMSYAPQVLEMVKEDSQDILGEDVMKYFNRNELNEVSMNLDMISSRNRLLMIFDVFFKKHFIKDLDYESFQELIFDFDEIKANGSNKKLGKEISFFLPLRKEKYDKFIINRSEYNGQLLKVECIFSRIYVEAGNGKEAIFDFRSDEFIAHMFTKGLRFGLIKEEIRKGLSSQYHKGTIANIRQPETGEASTMETVIDVEPVRKPVEVGEREKVDHKRLKCTFPQVDHEKNGGLIAIKNKPTIGKIGMQIDGRIIEGLPGEDVINVQTLCGEGIYCTEDEKRVYIRAKDSGFISSEMVQRASGVKMPSKLSVSKDITYRGDIGKETQSLEITCGEKISVSGNINKYYELVGNNIRIENGTIEGKVTSLNGNINVFGNVINGSIVALNGNSFINGNVITSSYIESLKGDIEIDYAEYSTIIGKNVRIKNAIGCTIICDNLESGEMNACNLLIKKSVSIEKLVVDEKQDLLDMKTEDTKIILLFKKDIVGNIETLKKIKRKMATYIHRDNSSQEALSKMEELNNLLSQINMKQEQMEREVMNTNDYRININHGNNELNLSIRLADFFESFDIENLRMLQHMKGEDEKERFLDKLSHLFSEWDNDHIGKLMLGYFNYSEYADYETNIIDLDFEKIKGIILKEINDDCAIRHPVEERVDGVERREEFRMDFGYFKKEDGRDTDFIFDQKIPIQIDHKDCHLKDISVGGIGFCIDKSKISDDEQIFYQENDIVDLDMRLPGLGGKEKIFNIKLILTFRREVGDKLIFGAKFIGLRGNTDTEMRQCIKKFEIEKIRKIREASVNSIDPLIMVSASDSPRP